MRIAVGHVGQQADRWRSARRPARASRPCRRPGRARPAARRRCRARSCADSASRRGPGRPSACGGGRAAFGALSWPAMSSPSNTMRPAVGVSMRSTASPVVDLPQPLSPTRPSVSPRRMVKRHAVDRLDGADLALDQDARGDREVDLQVLDARGCGRHVRSLGQRVRHRRNTPWNGGRPTLDAAAARSMRQRSRTRPAARRERAARAAGWRGRAAGPRSAPGGGRPSPSSRGTEAIRPRV